MTYEESYRGLQARLDFIRYVLLPELELGPFRGKSKAEGYFVTVGGRSLSYAAVLANIDVVLAACGGLRNLDGWVADAWDIDAPVFNDHDEHLVCVWSGAPIAYAPPDELDDPEVTVSEDWIDPELERELLTMLDEAAAEDTPAAQLEQFLKAQLEELVEEEFENDDDGETNE